MCDLYLAVNIWERQRRLRAGGRRREEYVRFTETDVRQDRLGERRRERPKKNKKREREKTGG